MDNVILSLQFLYSQYLFFDLLIYLIMLCVWGFCLYVRSCSTCLTGALRGHKKASAPPKLELRVVVSWESILGPLEEQQILYL